MMAFTPSSHIRAAFRVGFILLFVHASSRTAEAAYPYYGKLIQSGWGSGSTHDLAGDIYAVDENTFTVTGFKFDGLGDDAAFLLGTDKSYATASGSGSDSTAVAISNPLGQSAPLKAYNGETVTLELPSGKVLKDYKYIAVGIKGSKALYGGADIPANFKIPAPQNIGTFASRAHDVSSGEVTVLTDRTISIKAFNYDGQGPDAYFYVGITGGVVAQSAPYGIVPDEKGISSRKARAYSQRDIILTLPSTISASDLKWLSMYCIDFDHNFGEVEFPSDLNVPPYMEVDIDRQGMNCEVMSDDLQVSWIIEGDMIEFQMSGNIDRNKDYMAFGLSGSETRTAMAGADVVVADFRDGSDPRAVDYYISSLAQCSNNGGVCPDTSSFNSATDDIKNITGHVTSGITTVKFQRALTTGDVGSGNKDRLYKADGTEQVIVWAIGPLNTNAEAAKHYVGQRQSTEKVKKINFNRTLADNCAAFVIEAEEEKPDFQPHHLYGEEGTVFTVEIGQAGSEQGYKAITGQPSWGIAWYVNGILIPELHLKRGVSYTFRVGGGTDPTKGSQYHPLYFTDNKEGGFSKSNNGTIYPGKVGDKNEQYAVGGYCEWKLTKAAVSKADSGHIYQCFEKFQDDLYLNCESGTEYTNFVFTPDSSMPDTIYYQCYTHKNLGWKINLYDELPTTRIADVPCPVDTSSAACLTPVSVLLFTLLFISLMHKY